MSEAMQDSPRSGGIGWLKVLGFLALTVVLTTAVTVWIVKTYVFPSRFTPVELSAKEEKALDDKLERLESIGTSGKYRPGQAAPPKIEKLEPEAYSEEGAKREIALSERELNALIARNPDLADRVAIDLADGLVSAKVLVPLDEDFPFMGGQTLRLKAGVELAYAEGRPIVVLKGISVMGVPIPNAWLGGIKNIDLVREFGGDEGVWKAFAAGVEALQVSDGSLYLKLKE